MILDKETLLSDAQDLAQVVGTYVSTNSIDTAARVTNPFIWPNLNNGNTVTVENDAGKSNVDLLVQVTETFTSGGAATVQVQLIMSANANLSSPTILESTQAIALATLVAGYQFRLGGTLPVGMSAARYIGVQYVIGTATTTAGEITAALLLDRNTQSV